MSGIRLRLPATSANLGPGFDALALALELFLDISAETASVTRIEASGRSPEICSAIENNLLLDTCHGILAREERPVPSLSITMRNEIPLGMGCGSSAAVRLAGVALASHFGGLGWDSDRILSEAARLEGHPDNAAACWLGGFVASAWDDSGESVRAVTLRPPPEWRAVLVLPERPLPTSMSRAVLPDRYPRAEVVQNLQNATLLTAAFASGRGDLLAVAMRDQMHQPWRAKECPLLPALLPLAGHAEILGVALSGAGPAVLLMTPSDDAARNAERSVRARLQGISVEILPCALRSEGAQNERR
jgi:homoserine kinase